MLKFLGRALLVLIVLLVIAVGAFWFALPTERIGRVASDRLEAATGRTLTLSGDFSPTVWPRLGVATGPLSISNADWAEAPEMVTAEAAAVAVDLRALIGGRIEVETLRLEQPLIRLEVAEDGRRNWDLSPVETAEPVETTEAAPEADGEDAAGGPALTRLAAEIVDGTVIYDDRATGQVASAEEINLTLAYVEDPGSATLNGGATVNGIPATIDVTAESEGPLSALGALDLVAVIDSELGGVSFDGAVTEASSVAGDFTLSVADPAGAMARLALPPLPAAAGAISDVALDGSVAYGAEGLALETVGRVTRDAVPMTLAANVSGAADWQESGTLAAEINLDAADHVALAFDGTVATAGQVAGRTNISTPDLPRLIAWATGTPADLPPGAAGAMTLATDLAASAQNVSLDALDLSLPGLEADGRLGVALAGARPRITGALDTGPLNLDTFLGTPAETSGGGAGSGSGGGGSGESAPTPIPWDLLRLADADIALDAASFQRAPISLGPTTLRLTVDDGVARLDITETSGFGGLLAATIDANAATERLDITARLRSIRLEQVLSAFADNDRLEGAGALTLDLGGNGATLDDILATLSGEIAADLADGALKGINIAEIARNITGGATGEAARTDFTEARLSFDVTNGVLQAQELFALGPLVRLEGGGTISLPGQRLDLRLRPRIVGDLTGQGGDLAASGITLPVEVSGPWSDVSFRPDLSQLEELTRQQAEEAARQAADELRQGLTEGDPDEALDRAVDSITDTLRQDGGGLDQLRGLFGR